jgi:hypothetical protein
VPIYCCTKLVYHPQTIISGTPRLAAFERQNYQHLVAGRWTLRW